MERVDDSELGVAPAQSQRSRHLEPLRGCHQPLEAPDHQPVTPAFRHGRRALSETTEVANSTWTFSLNLRATFDVRWVAKRASDIQRLAVTRFLKSEMVPVAMVELNEAA